MTYESGGFRVETFIASLSKISILDRPYLVWGEGGQIATGSLVCCYGQARLKKSSGAYTEPMGFLRLHPIFGLSLSY
jgi:hypothetical protein